MAKAILNLSSTRALIERLGADATLRRILGFRTGRPLPHELAFSRVFGVLARTEGPCRPGRSFREGFRDCPCRPGRVCHSRPGKGPQYPEVGDGEDQKEAGTTEEGRNGCAARGVWSGPPPADNSGPDEADPSPGTVRGAPRGTVWSNTRFGKATSSMSRSWREGFPSPVF